MSNSTQTLRLARAALELHRLAQLAAEVQHMQSPATPRERNAKGVADPTATAVMCPRRLAVVDALNEASAKAATVADEIEQRAAALVAVVDTWQGLK